VDEGEAADRSTAFIYLSLTSAASMLRVQLRGDVLASAGRLPHGNIAELCISKLNETLYFSLGVPLPSQQTDNCGSKKRAIIAANGSVGFSKELLQGLSIARNSLYHVLNTCLIDLYVT
jgi:hypothetical protein